MYNHRCSKRIKNSWLLIGCLCMLLVGVAGCKQPKPFTQGQGASKRPPADPGGIPNLGGTCYLNSIMQVIAKLYPTTFLNSEKDLAKKGQIIVNKIAQDKKAVTTDEARRFFQALFQSGWHKEENSHEDPQECFEHIFTHLDCQRSILMWNKLCYGGNTNQWKQSIHPDGTKGFFIFSMIENLAIANNSCKKTLQAFIDDFFSGETVESSSSPTNKAKSVFRIENPPAILAIQAKRFVVTTTQYNDEKTKEFEGDEAREHIENPFNFIFKAEHQYNSGKNVLADIPYVLEAFILHSGSLRSGHYTAYIKHNGTWKHYDDRHVNTVDENVAKEAAKQAYLYFYKRTS